jgi:hypothetical protein
MTASDKAHASRRTARTLMAAVAALCVWHASHVVQAAFPARVLVLTSRSLPRAVRVSAISAIEDVATLVDPDEYARAAEAEGLDPYSVDALSIVAPNMHARVIVLLGVQQHMLVANFRSGRTGQPVHGIVLPLPHQKLDRQGQRQLQDATQLALSLAGQERPGFPAGPDTNAPPVEAPPEPAYEPQPEAQPQPPPQLQPNANAGPPAEWEDNAPQAPPPESQSEGDGATGEAATSEAFDPGLVTVLGFGVGVSDRSARLPTRLGERRLDTGLFPALDLSLSADGILGSHGLLGAHFHYQTSLGLQAAETPAAGTSKATSMRAHHVEFGLTPGYRFTTSEWSVTLQLFAGWAVRGLRSVVDTGLPPYMLHGPLLRPELRIPIADGALVLRFAPELLVIAGVTAELRRVGSTSSSGFAFGGEAALDIRVHGGLYLVLTYRESRASVATLWSADLTDTERFATARAVLRY